MLTACALRQATHELTLIAPDGQKATMNVEIADGPRGLQRGLMHRKELAADGMLFVFPNEQVRSFWMKNTLIPLDIFFFDANGLFVVSHTMDPCQEDPCPLYSSEAPVQFALEMPIIGSSSKKDIQLGWRIEAR